MFVYFCKLHSNCFCNCGNNNSISKGQIDHDEINEEKKNYCNSSMYVYDIVIEPLLPALGHYYTEANFVFKMNNIFFKSLITNYWKI